MRTDLYADLFTLEGRHWWHLSKRINIETLISRYKKIKPNILDIGCGTGHNLTQFKKFGQVYGLDSSKEAIEFCRKRGLTNIRFGKAENLPFPKNSFDIITMLDVLEHTDDADALKEAYRVLKKGGLLILTVPAFNWLWSEWDNILHHKRRYNRRNLLGLVTMHDFTVIRINYLYSFLLVPAFIIRQIKQKLFKKYSSDFKLSFSLLNKIMYFISRFEFKAAMQMPLPFGTSILVVAQK